VRSDALDGGNRTAPSDGARVHELGQLRLKNVDSDFYRRSMIVPGDSTAIGTALSRARVSGRFCVALLGGSVAHGTASKACCKQKKPRSGCCGPSYIEWLVRWLHEDEGIRDVQLLHKGMRGNGPETAALCVGEWFSTFCNKEGMNGIDLVVIDYAVNAAPATCMSSVDVLLARLSSIAPRAGILFVHTFSYFQLESDRSHCLNTLARYHGVPAVSWKEAAWPRLAHGLDTIKALFETQSAKKHPSAGGHKQMASVIAHALLELEARSQAAHALRSERAVHIPIIAPPVDGIDARAAARVAQALAPSCLLGPVAIEQHITTNNGWATDPSKGTTYAATRAGAELTLNFQCVQDGCGLLALLTKSYQPLGMLDVLVDGRLALDGYSEASPLWRSTRGTWITVAENLLVVPPADGIDRRAAVGEANASGAVAAPQGLSRGTHTVTFRARGETIAEARSWWSNYSAHEVRVEGMVVIYDSSDAKLRPEWDKIAPGSRGRTPTHYRVTGTVQ
jgi:hypothetical protein